MTVTAWILVVWMNGHVGYLTQGGIASEAECRALSTRLYDSGATKGAIYSRDYWCIPYEAISR